MTVYDDLSPDEQQLLRASIEATAVAISSASPGRKEETVSEGFAAASFVLGSGAEYVGHPLVGSVIVALEARLKMELPFPDYVEMASAPGAHEWAIETLRSAVVLLDEKAEPADAAAYKDWLMRIASIVAEAGKEDQGFLGRGGVNVNEAERAALQEVASVLGMAPSGMTS